MVIMRRPKAVLIVGVLLSDKCEWETIEGILRNKFGEIKDKTEPIEFSFTDYYKEEMGNKIKRFWVAFKEPVYEDQLADIKNFTISVENKFSENGRRTINLDPGYLNLSRLILASTKDFSHRIYLKDGIYGEVTLIYKSKKYTKLPWTYPDYQLSSLHEFLKSVRKSLLV